MTARRVVKPSSGYAVSRARSERQAKDRFETLRLKEGRPFRFFPAHLYAGGGSAIHRQRQRCEPGSHPLEVRGFAGDSTTRVSAIVLRNTQDQLLWLKRNRAQFFGIRFYRRSAKSAGEFLRPHCDGRPHATGRRMAPFCRQARPEPSTVNPRFDEGVFRATTQHRMASTCRSWVVIPSLLPELLWPTGNRARTPVVDYRKRTWN